LQFAAVATAPLAAIKAAASRQIIPMNPYALFII
jgi:hypothetical protein